MISGAVVNLDSENRTVLFASSGVRPMARRMGLGSTLPDEQAEPVDTATPLRSRAMTRPSPSIPRKVMFDVFGSRGTSAPLTVISMRFAISDSRRSRNAAAPSRQEPSAASFAATPKAAASGTFSVPGRRRRSCAPPNMCVDIATPRRTYSAPMPFGACILCAESDSVSQPSDSTENATFPAACTASQCK